MLTETFNLSCLYYAHHCHLNPKPNDTFNCLIHYNHYNHSPHATNKIKLTTIQKTNYDNDSRKYTKLSTTNHATSHPSQVLLLHLPQPSQQPTTATRQRRQYHPYYQKHPRIPSNHSSDHFTTNRSIQLTTSACANSPKLPTSEPTFYHPSFQNQVALLSPINVSTSNPLMESLVPSQQKRCIINWIRSLEQQGGIRD